MKVFLIFLMRQKNTGQVLFSSEDNCRALIPAVHCILLFLSGTCALFRMGLVSVEVRQTKRKNLNTMPADAVPRVVVDDAYPFQV